MAADGRSGSSETGEQGTGALDGISYYSTTGTTVTINHTLSADSSAQGDGPGSAQVGGDLGTYSVSIHATPYDFTKTIGVAESDGTLDFAYNWKSTTGSVTDLDSCYEHEYVTYPTTNRVFDGINFFVPPASFDQPDGFPNPTTQPGFGYNGLQMTSTLGMGDIHSTWSAKATYMQTEADAYGGPICQDKVGL